MHELHKTIGPYRVQEVVGHGGMSTVYKAIQPDLERTVAIKVLLPALVDDEQFRRRFQREAHLIARLRHPHIVAIYGVGEDEGAPYLAMEYLEGPTLHAAIHQRRQAGAVFSPREALELLKPLASALDFAHDHHVIHCDLKPENIVLTARGPVITDFGLAKLIQQEVATISLVMGTPSYMAPEQIEGRPVDRRTDVYALGILLYELLTGRVPFRKPTPSAVLHAHLHQPAPALADLNPRLHPSPLLEEVARRAIAKRPEDRWPSAGAMIAALTRALAAPADVPAIPGRPTVPPTGRTTRVERPPATDHDRARLALLVPLAALLVAGLWAGSGWARRDKPVASTDRRPVAATTVISAPTTRPGPTSTPVATTAPLAVASAGPTLAPTAVPVPVASGSNGQPMDQVAREARPVERIPARRVTPARVVTPDRAVRGRIRASSGARVRSGPGPAYRIAGVLRDGTTVTVASEVNGWLEVVTETGAHGWVAASLIEVEGGDLAGLPAPAVLPPPPSPAQPAAVPPAPAIARPAAAPPPSAPPQRLRSPQPAPKERPVKERATKEQPARQQAANERRTREQPAKERTVKERAAKGQAARERPAREQPAKERTTKEQPGKSKGRSSKG